jgi:hypothetical protein
MEAMKNIFLISVLFITMQANYAISAELMFNNSVLSEAFAAGMENNDSQTETWDVAALRTVLQDSNLYKILLTANITLPNMVKTGEYVMLLNEVHRMNQNLELILQELRKMNGSPPTRG